MPKIHSGLVVGKDFRHPQGADPAKWCYLVVDLSNEERIAVRLHESKLDTAVVGDKIVFSRPRNPNRQVRLITRR